MSQLSQIEPCTNYCHREPHGLSFSLSNKSHCGATSYLHMHPPPLNISRIDKGNSCFILNQGRMMLWILWKLTESHEDWEITCTHAWGATT